VKYYAVKATENDYYPDVHIAYISTCPIAADVFLLLATEAYGSTREGRFSTYNYEVIEIDNLDDVQAAFAAYRPKRT
jgi:hypothetical protein